MAKVNLAAMRRAAEHPGLVREVGYARHVMLWRRPASLLDTCRSAFEAAGIDWRVEGVEAWFGFLHAIPIYASIEGDEHAILVRTGGWVTPTTRNAMTDFHRLIHAGAPPIRFALRTKHDARRLWAYLEARKRVEIEPDWTVIYR